MTLQVMQLNYFFNCNLLLKPFLTIPDCFHQLSFIAVTCGVSGTSAEGRKELAHRITSNSWREDKVVWHVTSECASNVYETMNNINRYNAGLSFGFCYNDNLLKIFLELMMNVTCFISYSYENVI